MPAGGLPPLPHYRSGAVSSNPTPGDKAQAYPLSSPQPELSQPTLDITEPDDVDPITQELRQQQGSATTGRLRPVRNRAGRVVMARVSKRRCNSSCQYAKGPTCVCACGGINHGIGNST